MHFVRLLQRILPVLLVESDTFIGPSGPVAGLPLHRRQPRHRRRRAPRLPRRRLSPLPLPHDHELHRGLPEGLEPFARDRTHPPGAAAPFVLKRRGGTRHPPHGPDRVLCTSKAPGGPGQGTPPSLQPRPARRSGSRRCRSPGPRSPHEPRACSGPFPLTGGATEAPIASNGGARTASVPSCRSANDDSQSGGAGIPSRADRRRVRSPAPHGSPRRRRSASGSSGSRRVARRTARNSTNCQGGSTGEGGRSVGPIPTSVACDNMVGGDVAAGRATPKTRVASEGGRRESCGPGGVRGPQHLGGRWREDMIDLCSGVFGRVSRSLYHNMT